MIKKLFRTWPVAVFFFVSVFLSGPGDSAEAIIPTFLLKNDGLTATKSSRPQLISRVRLKKPAVALTFDDGPKPEFSEDILDILEFYNIRATFFVVGRLAVENPQIIDRMVKSGHLVANHTYDHLRLAGLPDGEITRQLADTNRALLKITGQPTIFFRAPGGRFNQHILLLAAAINLTGIGWSLNAGDYVDEYGHSPRLTSAELVKKIISHSRPGDIILMHNGGRLTREALPQIIRGLQEKNFELVTVGELIRRGQEEKQHAG